MKPKINREQLRLKLVKDDSDIACYHCGSKSYVKKGFSKGVEGAKQQYQCKECNKKFVDNPEYHRTKKINTDDVWNPADLGIRIYKHTNTSKIIAFDLIKQDWLKEAAKRFIKYMSSTKELGTLQHYTGAINKLSDFLLLYPSVNNFEKIDRQLILDFIYYLQQKDCRERTMQYVLSSLRLLFEIGNINRWFTIESYLITTEDFPKKVKSLPRYIPEEVMQKLNQHLDSLPEPVLRMVLVIQECGLRIGELLLLPINCLKQDSKGNYFIQFMRWKMKQEDQYFSIKPKRV